MGRIVGLNGQPTERQLHHNATLGEVVNIVAQAVNQATAGNMGPDSVLVQMLTKIHARLDALEAQARGEAQPVAPEQVQ